MYKSEEPIYFNEDRIPSANGAVIIYRTEAQKQKVEIRKFLAGMFMASSLVLMSFQTAWVYNANAEGSPVTSPVTSEESASPSSSPSSTPSGTPITSPEEPSPSPSASPSSPPATSPEVSPSPSSNPAGNKSSGNNSGGSSNSSSNSGGGSVNAPGCNTQKPGSAPVIISALTTGKNEITLTWNKAQNPLTHYVIVYGLEKGKPLYGNPNVGNVTSYTVKGLSGGVTYYFKVRAGNDCMPGPYSGEIAVKVGGKFINSPAQGFKPGVLGKTIKKNMPLASSIPRPAALSKPQSETNSGLFGKVFSFLSNIFKP